MLSNPVKPINQRRKQLEEALQAALEQYFNNKKNYLTNGKGDKFFIGAPACRDLCLSERNDFDKINALMGCNTNYHPCLVGTVTLCLSKENEAIYQHAQYFFHISGDKSAIGGDADYEIYNTNNEVTVTIKYVDYFILNEDRLF